MIIEDSIKYLYRLQASQTAISMLFSYTNGVTYHQFKQNIPFFKWYILYIVSNLHQDHVPHASDIGINFVTQGISKVMVSCVGESCTFQVRIY